MGRGRLLILALLAAALAAYLLLDLGRFLDLGLLKVQHQALLDYRAANPLLSTAAFFALCGAACWSPLPQA